MSSHAYLPTSFSDSERRRLAKRLMGKRLALPGERASRWPLYSILAIAAALAVAGIFRGGF